MNDHHHNMNLSTINTTIINNTKYKGVARNRIFSQGYSLLPGVSRSINFANIYTA